MKKIFTLLVLAASITTGFAQWQPSSQQRGGPQQRTNYPQKNNNYGQYGSLVVTSAMQKQISVFVDNQQYQNNGNNGNGDNNGNTGNNGYGNTVNIRQLSAGNHNIAIYQFKTNLLGKQVRQEIYNSSLNFKPGFETTISINGLGQVNVSEQQVNNDGGGYGNNGNGVGNGYGRKKNKNKNKNYDKDHDDDDDRRYDQKKDKKDKKDKNDKKDKKDRDDD